MLAIVLGYTAKGGTAPPTVLYAGRDATAADAQSLNPPAGIIRTELIKHPVVQRTRTFEVPEPVEEVSAQPELLTKEPSASAGHGEATPAKDPKKK